MDTEHLMFRMVLRPPGGVCPGVRERPDGGREGRSARCRNSQECVYYGNDITKGTGGLGVEEVPKRD